ncbi:MAG: DUF3108 domain-containing protein [Cytophagales bacterium]|nr:DUF3108 domain-containing protein [Rhizobacter sp.]
MVARLTNGVHARRLLAGAGLVWVVSAGHVLMADLLARHASQFAQAQAMPPRMEVTYVREMTLAEPPARLAAAPTKRRVRTPIAAPAASVPTPLPPEVPVVAAVPTELQPALLAEVQPPAPAASGATSSAVPSAVPSADTTPPFEWPVSTRMRYVLTGNFRGEVHGDAQVEWVRAGSRYQVHLDISVGLLASRRMSSDGDITSEGLAPRRYDQETKLAFDDPHRTTVRFEGERILLANGQVLPRWPGVQDTVSQFVQLSWMFDSQPGRLRVGQTVEIPLAMPRNVSSWVYDVVEEETLYTPFGEVQAFHLKPRRAPRAGGDMTVDIWIAPQLRHMPVRFRIRPDTEAYFDLMLDRRPELAASDRP